MASVWPRSCGGSCGTTRTTSPGQPAWSPSTWLPSYRARPRRAMRRRPGLRTIVGTVVGHTAPRFERLLRSTNAETVGRYFDPDRYATARRLDGESILLIDDTWSAEARPSRPRLRYGRPAPHTSPGWLTPSFGGEWGTVGEHYGRLSDYAETPSRPASSSTPANRPSRSAHGSGPSPTAASGRDAGRTAVGEDVGVTVEGTLLSPELFAFLSDMADTLTLPLTVHEKIKPLRPGRG